MVVSITWSQATGGAAISEPISHGNISNGMVGSDIDLYIRHNAVAGPITNVGFFIQPYSGTGYTGIGQLADYNEIMGWGAAAVSWNDAGFYINQNHPTFPDDISNWKVHKPGQGDSAVKIALLASAINIGTPVAGEIPLSGEAHVQVKVAVPALEDTAGVRFFDQVLAYTYTS
jgi:hypothetical protein